MWKKYLENSPYIIAKKIQTYIDADTYAEKYDLIEKIYTQILRYFSCVCLSEYLIDSDSNVKVNGAINGLIRPSIGNWLNFLNTYIKYQRKADKQLFIIEMSDVFKKLLKSKVEVLAEESVLNEYEKENVLEAILVFRNKLRHGSYTPNEAMSKGYVEIYEPIMLEILESFLQIFKTYKIVSYKESEGISLSFMVLSGEKIENFKIIEKEEDFEDEIEFQEDELYLLSQDDRVLPLNELFKKYLKDEYLIYDGLNKLNIKYAGIERSYTIEKYIDRLRTKFSDKKISLKFGRKLLDIKEMKSYINDLSLISVKIHEESKKYDSRNYVKRAADYQVEKFLQSDKTGLIITAEAGSGKTNLMCNVTKKCIEYEEIVYFINGYKLIKPNLKTPIFSEFIEEIISQNEFSTIGEFFEILDKKMENNKKFILIVDAVNESYCGMEILSELNKMISQLPKYNWLKIIITIRTEYYKTLKHYATERMGKGFFLFSDPERYYFTQNEMDTQKELKIKNWTIIEQKEAFDKYKEQYQIKCKGFFELPPQLWKLLAVPLNMKIYFSVLVREGANKKEILNRKDLFGAYHTYLVKEAEGISKATYELLLYTVKQMIEKRRSCLETENIDNYNDLLIKREKIKDMMGVLTPYERLLDQGILQERLVNNWYETKFVYQAYLEFLIYLHLQEKKYTDEKLIALYMDSMKWIELPEMHEAIQLYLLEEKSDIFQVVDLLLNKVVSNQIKLDLVKESIVKLIYDMVLNYSGNKYVEKMIKSAIECLKKYELYEWLIDIGNKLLAANLPVETQILFLAIKDYVDLFKNQKSKCTLYNVLGVISRQQCEPIDNTITYFKKAMVYASKHEQIIIQTNIAKTYRINVRVENAEQILDKLLQLDSELKEFMIPSIMVVYQRQLCYRARGDYSKSLELCKSNFELRGLIENEDVKLNLKAEYATELEFSGFIDESIDMGQQVLNEASDLGNMGIFIDTMNGLSRRYQQIGKYEESIYWAKEGLQLWEYSKYYRGQLVMCIHILNSLKGKGESIQTAKVYLDKAKEIVKVVKEELILDMYNNAISKWKH